MDALGEQMDDPSVTCSSPYKLVPQSMVDNVMAVCPDVDPKDVAKDLVITGSATRTINRILDGQVSKEFIFESATQFSQSESMQTRSERAAEIVKRSFGSKFTGIKVNDHFI